MPLIKNNAVVSDDKWALISEDGTIPSTGDVVLSLARVQQNAEALSDRSGKLGVRVDPEDDIAEVAKVVSKVSLVVLTFPKFGDGRAYSKARLLRERYGFKGEIRAVGEVLADQLQYMLRCGFDAFELAEGKDVNAALRAMRDFTVTYQAAVDDPPPLYRRATRGEKSV